MTKKERKKQEDFIAKARRRFKNLTDADNDNRTSALKSIEFVYNINDGQWDDTVKAERDKAGRPYLTSNKLRKFVAQVANRERDQRLAGDVAPVDDKADPQTAKILQGMIRQIEYASNAEEIYTQAGEQAIAGGFGFWRIITKETPDSFEQEIFLKKIENQFSVSLDPRGNYGFIREAYSKDEFEQMYPGEDMTDFDLSNRGEEYELWYEEDKVFVAEYFWKEQYDKEIAEIGSLETGETQIVELTDEITPELLLQNGWNILRRKTSKADKVKWAKITGSSILEEGEWAGTEIPIIEVKGDWVNVAGRVVKRSLTVDAEDNQRMYNYWLTTMTETVALAPKAPYLVTPEEIGDYSTMWDSANIDNRPYLLFRNVNGRVPQREAPPTIPTGAAQMLQIAAGDIQDTVGMYNASFGERSNERTGVAIQQRAVRSDFSTYHFTDNYGRAIKETIRQLIDLIPKIYDTERIVRILGEDGSDQLVKINEEIVDIGTGTKIIVNDLSKGKYDVLAGTKLWSTRRQEAAENMAAMAQAMPNVAPLFADLIFEYNDWDGASIVRDRIQQNMGALMGQKQPPEGGQPMQ